MLLKIGFTLILMYLSSSIYAQNLAINLWQNPTQLVNVQYNINQKVNDISQPQMVVYLPKKNNHHAILVMSGGGYAHEELGKEGTPTSQWLQQQGFTVFELIYRLPKNNPLLPFADGQRAIRIMRSQAKIFDYDPQKIGVLGFSAGGHLASILATQFNSVFYKSQEPLDTLSAKPNFAVLVYPVISMLPPLNHTHAFKSLFPKPNATLQTLLSAQDAVTPQTPPMLIFHAKNDPISPVQNSLLMQQALAQAHVTHQVYIFDNGGHGWGIGKPNTQTMQWRSLFLQWVYHN
ncbi:alpha/beta hydrolase [Acinetobacter sp. HY1485]|uniref:alpha/beta hydrolase n=1 Tax=Acinetobacter sp. HY1485 TaxID=2970918 RepID=UPI0022B9ACC4|nr:alpha/beta hydrolase [Acinetobacter sp. HY1485]